MWRVCEEQAALFYERRGYTTLERNWRAGRYEIDLIARRDQLIVFVEVKSATTAKFGHPAEWIDRKKIENLTRAAQRFLIERTIDGCDLRFDVVTFSNGRLERYPNAFEAAE